MSRRLGFRFRHSYRDEMRVKLEKGNGHLVLDTWVESGNNGMRFDEGVE
jgi:hypothetical protein